MDSRNSDSRRSSSSSGTSGVKSKWIKAFRSLKLTTVGSSSRNEVGSRENQNAMRISAHLGVHAFQEYTYKKITACDVCREILRGHARQGLKCKLCKMNVHSGCCQENAPKCQPKPRLLRKQKSASELETKIAIPQIEDERANYDPMYQSLRAAADARRCAQYVSDGYMASHEYTDNGNGSSSSGVMGKNSSGNYHHHLNHRADSNEGSSNNVSMATSATNINNGHGGGGGHLGSSGALANHEQTISAAGGATISQHRNSTADEQQQQQQYHQQQQCYQQQQPPPPLLRYNNHHNSSNNSSGYSSSGNGNHELQRMHIKTQQPQHPNSPALLSITQTSHQTYSAPHSPQKKKLTLRMKSLSLDSPESAETLASKGSNDSSGVVVCGPGNKVGARIGSGGPVSMPNNSFAPGFYPAVGGSSSSSVHTPPYEPEVVMGGGGGNYKYKGAPLTQSPAMPKRFKLGMHGRMCSIESDPTMVDLSSSLSPCPSPKPQRLLPTNIFVVLYNFRSRQLDELNLRAGYMVTVVDTTDPDWWQGKCLGQVGYFPSKYVTKLFPGERPLQVIHTVQVNDGEFATKLIREQVSDEVNGIIMVRTGINEKIVPCPSKYLQEINL